MGAPLFNNEMFDSWLETKTQDILSKVDRERITTEEMIVLVLKGQTNHFHHMDMEFRTEFANLNKRFERIDVRLDNIDARFEKSEAKYVSLLEQSESRIASRFEKSDKRSERIESDLRSGFLWLAGIMITLFAGIYLKLFLV